MSSPADITIFLSRSSISAMRDFFALDLHHHFFFVARENLLKHFQQIKQSNRDFRIVFVSLDFSPLENGPFDSGARPEHLRCRFVLLILEQLID